mmetsp:Transcript_10980/g.26059  ORF Transcript_10980/g.26059 Transcript_10980/m.26059 type:complete len:166 (-) Transcript_10980:160-657(-)
MSLAFRTPLFPVAQGGGRIPVRNSFRGFRVRASKDKEPQAAGDSGEIIDPVGSMMDSLYNKEGYRIKYGVFKEKVEKPEGMTFQEFFETSKEERMKKQQEAARELVNIDSVERDRRTKVGGAFLTGTGALMAAMLVAGASPSARALVSIPLFLGLGFFISGQTGL